MNMRRASLALLAVLAAWPALGADNAVILTPGTGVTLRSKDIGGGVQSMLQILGDTSGNPIYGVAGTANANVITIQGVASMTPVGVSVANGGVASGAYASGAFASGAFASGSIASGAIVNGADVAEGTTTDVPCTLPASGTACSLIAVNKALANAANSSIPAGSALIGYTSNDVCNQAAKTNLPISFQATSIAQLIALSGTTKIYICSLSLIASAATVFSITGGTGTNCGTPAALIGTTSATHGLSLAANGGLTLGNGAGTVAVTAAGSELCIVQSGSGDLVGNLTYVQQ